MQRTSIFEKISIFPPQHKCCLLIIIPWIINCRIKVKKTYCKDWSNNVKKAKVYNISTGQYQSSSGLLGKTTNIQNIYYCKKINRSYMVWHGKVWLLRKINRKKDKDYTIKYCSSRLKDRWLWLYEWGAPHVLPTTIAFISKCFNWVK